MILFKLFLPILAFFLIQPFIDAAPAYTVTRLTAQTDTINAVLYMTGNGFTSNDHSLIYNARLSGKWQIMEVDLATGQQKQWTNNDALRPLGGSVAYVTDEVFYGTRDGIHQLDLKKGVDQILWRIPEGFSGLSPVDATPDGNIIVFTFHPRVKFKTKTAVLNSNSAEKYTIAKDNPNSSIMMVGRRTNHNQWHFTEVMRSTGWINHTAINPGDGKTILFSFEGPHDLVTQRMWLVNTDGTNRRPVRIEENTPIIITHEFWFDHGRKIGYQNYTDNSFGVVDMNDEQQFKEYPLWEHHTHNFAKILANGNLLVFGDGHRKNPFSYFYTINPQQGEIINRQLVAPHHTNTTQEYWHLHARFSPTGKYLIYATANDLGGGDIYLISNIPE